MWAPIWNLSQTFSCMHVYSIGNFIGHSRSRSLSSFHPSASSQILDENINNIIVCSHFCCYLSSPRYSAVFASFRQTWYHRSMSFRGNRNVHVFHRKKYDKSINNDLQSQRLSNRSSTKVGMNSSTPEVLAVPDPLVVPFLFLCDKLY